VRCPGKRVSELVHHDHGHRPLELLAVPVRPARGLPQVRLVELRLADGLGGKGVVLFSGLVADVEAAVRLATGALEIPELLVRDVVIPQLHPGLWENVGESTWFGSLVMGKL